MDEYTFAGSTLTYFGISVSIWFNFAKVSSFVNSPRPYAFNIARSSFSIKCVSSSLLSGVGAGFGLGFGSGFGGFFLSSSAYLFCVI